MTDDRIDSPAVRLGRFDEEQLWILANRERPPGDDLRFTDDEVRRCATT